MVEPIPKSPTVIHKVSTYDHKIFLNLRPSRFTCYFLTSKFRLDTFQQHLFVEHLESYVCVGIHMENWALHKADGLCNVYNSGF